MCCERVIGVDRNVVPLGCCNNGVLFSDTRGVFYEGLQPEDSGYS